MTKQVTEAEADAAVANAFGHKPTGRVVSEAVEASPMSFDEALDVTIGAAFGRSPDRGRVAEAADVLRGHRSTSTGSANIAIAQRMAGLMDDVARLAESRLGYSADRAALHAQSEALRCRESSASVARAVEVFEMYRDALITRPMHSLRGLRGSTSASESGRQRPSGSTTKVVRS